MKWGESSLKSRYPKYKNFPFVKTMSNKNSRDISMPVCNRKLWECKPLHNRCDALSGKTHQIYSTGCSFLSRKRKFTLPARFKWETEWVAAYLSRSLKR